MVTDMLTRTSASVSHQSLLTAAELAPQLRLSVGQVYRLARTKQIPSHRVGSAVRFNIEDVLSVTVRTPVLTSNTAAHRLALVRLQHLARRGARFTLLAPMSKPSATTKPKPLTLTKKQTAFRDAILSGFTPSEAYRKAFDAKAMSRRAISANAGKLLKHHGIALAIRLAVNDGKVSAIGPPLSPTIRLSMEERLEELRCAAPCSDFYSVR